MAGQSFASSVGIFLGVRDIDGPLVLLADRSRLEQAESYGNFLTHALGHLEVWERWSRLGPTGLERRKLPAFVAWHEYEHFPRGRVVFETEAKRFAIYADRSLQTPETLKVVVQVFHLGDQDWSVHPDPHYCAVPDL